MTDYKVTDTELTNVANAIRTKGGTSSPLEWPQGYIDAIDAISGGGGSANGFPVVEKYAEDMKRGYISENQFNYDLSDGTRIDMWEVRANRWYIIILGSTIGNRFRAMFTTTDLTQATQNVAGVGIDYLSSDTTTSYMLKGSPISNISGHPRVPYKPSSDGYIAVSKTNQNVTGIPCYLIDVTDPPSSGSQNL